MGRKSAGETIAKILVALVTERTVKQADLARHCDVGTRVIRRHMVDLMAAMPEIERNDEHPHVYYSVPPSWFPDGKHISRSELADIMRLIARHPRVETRERILERLVEVHRVEPVRNQRILDEPSGVVTRVEDACAKKVALAMSYFSAHRGEETRRHVSIHRIEYGGRLRFVATCHRDDHLKWFRVDAVHNATLDSREPFRAADPNALAEFVRTSLAGFRSSGRATEESFLVPRSREAHWITRNLPDGAITETLPTAIRVLVTTAALDPLARFVVGLGENARIETEPLRRRVVELAHGALRINRSVLKTRTVGTKRATA